MSFNSMDRSLAVTSDFLVLPRAFKATNSHQLSIVILPLIMVILATIAVWLRFRARGILKMKPQIDDWFSLGALILTWAFQCVNIVAVFKGGAGLPIETVLASSPNALATYLKLIVANFSLWVITVTVVQVSILFLYLRVFGISRVFTWLAYIFLFSVISFGIAGFVSELTSCIPLKKSWEPQTPGHCYNSLAACKGIGLIHVFFDFGIVFLPMPWIWRLNMRKNSKVVVTILLSIGLMASIFSLLKTNCLSGLNLAGKPQADVTDYLWLVILFQTLELPLGIICSCVPTMTPVWAQMAPQLSTLGSRLLSRIPGSSSSRSGGSGSGSRNPASLRKGSEPNMPFQKLGDESATAINKASFSTMNEPVGEDIAMNDLN